MFPVFCERFSILKSNTDFIARNPPEHLKFLSLTSFNRGIYSVEFPEVLTSLVADRKTSWLSTLVEVPAIVAFTP